MAVQIVHRGHTPMYIWDKLRLISTETRIPFTPQCPICQSKIQPTATGLRCVGCQAPTSVFQQPPLIQHPAERVIYVDVKGQIQEVLKLNLQCPSCQEPIHKDETCQNTCGIQTYIVLDSEDTNLYIKRWANHIGTFRNPPEIPIRSHFKIRESSPSILDQILVVLDDGNDFPTHGILSRINAHPNSIKKQLSSAVKNGLILKVRHGYYRRSESEHSESE